MRVDKEEWVGIILFHEFPGFLRIIKKKVKVGSLFNCGGGGILVV